MLLVSCKASSQEEIHRKRFNIYVCATSIIHAQIHIVSSGIDGSKGFVIHHADEATQAPEAFPKVRMGNKPVLSAPERWTTRGQHRCAYEQFLWKNCNTLLLEEAEAIWEPQISVRNPRQPQMVVVRSVDINLCAAYYCMQRPLIKSPPSSSLYVWFPGMLSASRGRFRYR